MLRIQIIVLSDFKGGMEYHVKQLASNFISKGHKISLICGKGFFSPDLTGVEIVEINASANRYNPHLLYKVYRAIQKFQPDILHCHGGKAARVVSLIPGTKQTKYVSTVHGIKRISSFYQKFDMCIGVSKAVTELVSAQNIPCKTVYNGLSVPDPAGLNDETSKKLSDMPEGFTWIAVGRLVPVKGFDLALRALAKTKHNLVIIGDGPEARVLKQLTSDLQLENRVKFLGHIGQVWDLYLFADATLITSLREGFSYVFLESMMVNRPVLSTDVPIANEVLPDQYICQSRSPDQLSFLMEELAKQGPEKSIQSEEMKFCQKELTESSMIDKTETLYKELISSSRNA